MDLRPGARVKDYILERQLGKGASGEVWKAYDETKTVAIKFMNESLMTSASASKHRERLIREVESLRRLQHPNIPTLYDYDLDYKRPYIAMRYVGGDSYDRLISSGEMLKIPLERRLEMIRDIAFALTAAHEAGIIHRDIKPANLTGIENPYLLDFSISLESEDVEHTQRFVGTTLYMSGDGVADRLSDSYSFAVVVYEMLFGRHPIYQLGDSIFNQFIAEMRMQNRQWSFPSAIPQSQLPADLQQADLRRLDVIFERAMGRRETRYADLREFVRDLRSAILPHESTVEPARVASVPVPAPAASRPPAPRPEPKPQPVEEVSPEESDFLNKAFLNLPAIKPEQLQPEPQQQAEQPKPDLELEQTSLVHQTVPYDYEAQRRLPNEEPSARSDDHGERESAQASGKAADMAESLPGFAGPEERTMMEIRVPPQREEAAEAEKPPVPVAGPEERTMMEIPVKPEVAAPSAEPVPPTPPSTPERSVPPEPQIDATIRDMPVFRSAPPAHEENFTQLEVRSPRSTPAPQRSASDDNFTLLESQSPQPRRLPQTDFTRMEMESAPRSPSDDSFTLMEMQSPPRAGIPSPMSGDNFTLLEVASTQDERANASTKRRSRVLLIVALLVIVIVVVVAIIVLASSGAGLP